MTNGDLQQIREVMREEVAAAEQRLRGEIAAAEQRMGERIAATEQHITAATTANLSDLRAELNVRIDNIERHLGHIDSRLDRLTEALRLIEHRMASVNKWADGFDTSQAEFFRQYQDQQRVITLLTARVAALEAKLQGHQ